MYNLRPREPVQNKRDSTKREPVKLSNPRKKAQRTQTDNEFDPKTFKDNDDIYDDSSDSDFEPSDDERSEEVDDEGNLKDFIDSESEEEYFDLNRSPLVKLVTQRLRKTFPDISEEELKTAVKVALEKAGDLADEYCGAVPKDVSWKIGLEDDVVGSLEPELKQLRQNIQDTTPTIPKILQSGMLIAEKERALQLYDALQNLEPHTIEYMQLRMQLGDMIRNAPTNLDPAVNQQLSALRTKIEQTVPTLEKITAALLPESDKIQALQLYDMLQRTSPNTDEWFKLRRRINVLLDAQFKSAEEVTRIEEEEASLKKQSFNFHADLKRQIFELDADDLIKGRIYELYSDMISRGPTDSQYDELRDKVIWTLRLPHRKRIESDLRTNTPEQIRHYCQTVYSRLNSELYGMQAAKERVIQVVNDQIHNPQSRNILALRGKPGVGKTKLAKTIAKAIGRPFDKISLGGAIDSTIFKGSSGVWVGSTPSVLLQTLARTGCSNAVILLDEIDKLSISERGREVQQALLHILDPTQNKEVQDAYLNEIPHDFSQVWFICAMNDGEDLDPALRDRLNIVDVPSYSKKEMVCIATRHTFPEALQERGISDQYLSITEPAVEEILKLLGKEVEAAGMRPVERAINDVVSKINLLRTLGTTQESNSHSVQSTLDIPLSYSLPDFKDFPYIITDRTIRQLMKAPTSTTFDYYL